MASLASRSFSSLFTLTRASAATFFDANGILQTAAAVRGRIDHNPDTLAVLGLLVEGARTNLALYSNDCSNAAWSKTNVTVTTGAGIGPDGQASAQKLAATGTATTSLHQAITATATKHVHTIFAKAGNLASNVFKLRNETTAADLVTATVTWSTRTVSGTGASIQKLPNGWVRVTLIATTGISIGNSLRIFPGFTGESLTAADYLYVFGNQLEAGAFASSYIPTTTASATRNADAIASTSISPWLTEEAGTIYAEYSLPWAYNSADTAEKVIAQLDDGTANNRHAIYWASNSVAAKGLAASAGQYDIAGAAHTAGSTIKHCLAWAENDVAAAVNGVLTTDSAATMPAGLTTLRLGSASASGSEPFMHLRALDFYPERLSNTRVLDLTR